MSPELFAFVIGVAVFAGGAIGLLLQRLLHERHTTGPARDMIGAVVGLVTLLSALVLGLLIWTAYGVYNSQNLAVQSLAAKVLQLDFTLADYGSQAVSGRAVLRSRLKQAIDEVWRSRQGDQLFVARNFSAAIANERSMEKYLGTLHPSTPAQTQALASAQALVAAIGQARLQMSFGLTDPVSYPLLLTVVTWATCLFLGYGLMSRAGATSLIALAVAALAVGSAALLILDLSAPYAGAFRASPAPLEQVLNYLNKG
jgi:hypothetical protein